MIYSNIKILNLNDLLMNNNYSQTQLILKYTYGLVPIVAGLDKFTNLLTDWSHYLSNAVINILPFSADVFMYLVGIIEIGAGIFVFLRPKQGAYVVMIWLILIALNLVITGDYFDIAVRDLTMAVGAYSLGKLSSATGQPKN